MSDNYNIKIGVDSRSGARGVKQFSSALGEALRTLREFDKRSRSAFDGLKKLASVNIPDIAKKTKAVQKAIETLNRVQINRRMINDLQRLQNALAGFRFNAKAISKVPEALRGLSNLKIDTSFVSTLNQIKAALKGFRGPPKALAQWAGAFTPFAKVKIDSTLAPRLTALKAALKGFPGLPKGLVNLPTFLRGISRNRIPPSVAQGIASLKTALAGFAGPSAAATRNLSALVAALARVSPGHLAQVAAALARLNGLNINVRGLGSMNNAAQRGAGIWTNMGNSIRNTTNAFRGLNNQISLTHHASTLLATALGSVSLGTFVNSVYEAGSALINLKRTMGAIAGTPTEVNDHLSFLKDLTNELPVSLDAVARSYGKFAVAARLSGTSVADTQKVYKGFATALSAMGVSADNQKYAFLALEQMFSKGTIQMEELRVQLGDHIPGVVPMLAEALDVSTSKLLKMIEAGEVGSDALIKLAEVMQSRFGPAVAAAMNTSAAQITSLQNAWTEFKRILFDSGFNAGLGAMARQFAEILRSDDFKKFAADLGRAMGEAFKLIGALGKVLADNRDKVITFAKALAGVMVAYSIVGVLRLLVAPLSVVGGLFSFAATAVRLFGGALALLAGGKAVAAVANIAKSIGVLTGKVMAAVAAFGLLAILSNEILGDGKLAASFGNMLDAFGKRVGKMIGEMTGGVTEMFDLSGVDGFSEYMKEADEYAKKIQDANQINAESIEKNAERYAKLEEQKKRALTTEQQKLWDEINAIGKANEEYQKQLLLIDEIAKKRGFDPKSAEVDRWRKMLAENTLDDRNPAGAMARDYRQELAMMKAKTAEQKALASAQEDYNELLKKGQDVGKEGLEALRQYHEGIARMNGEIGNGVERWAASVGDFNDQVQEAIKDGISSLSDEITNFVTGAEADFASLGRSILKTFVKISLDSMLKDIAGWMGMDGEKKGASMAEKAMEKLAGIGENITTAMTNVYTNGLTINGEPVTGAGGGPNAGMSLAEQYASYGAGKAQSNAAKQAGITRAPLPDIPGTNVAPAGPSTNDRFATEPGFVKPMKTLNDGVRELDRSLKSMPDGWGPGGIIGANTTAKTNRVGFVDPERFAPGVNPNANLGLRGAIDPITTSALPAGGGVSPTINGFTFSKFSEASYQQISNQLMDRLKQDFNLTDNQAGGIVANLAHESVGFRKLQEMKPLVPGSRGGYGIAQWTGPRRREYEAFAAQGGWTTDSPEAQYQFLKHELMGKESRSLSHLRQQSGLGESVVSFQDKFERPGIPHTASRMTHADRIMNGYQPGTGLQPGVDPTATAGIDQMKAKVTEVGQAAQQATPAMDQMKSKLSETGTSAQTGASQTQMANQMKTQSELQMGLTAQQTGIQVQSAGTMAASAGPQFQQAGTAIQQAGTQAQMGAQQAQSATPGLGQFGQGISQLLGPLSSVIPGLGQFGSMILQLLQQLMTGGMGGMGAGLFSEGGYSDSPVTRARVSAAPFMGAPHYSEGTPNTSGGMPAILHDNEAVIPLTRGRKVPVEMNEGDSSRAGRQDYLDRSGPPNLTFHLHGVKDADSFKRSKSQIGNAMTTVQQRSRIRDG
ncbi:tape measure protein [Pseudaminobacter sp. 19-2017]|uniref:Tape measure protein n=1 Tax=Pseudaminobacter soli (ex Zhang et al. 2022) TaxID=2831468 RepID=A0A942DWR9_9HYPH|nr:phage tail tip lysozyme [Pseudaminobacter soli]MBS3648869.1 tape measure protein [Pseudaminobacter soli]